MNCLKCGGYMILERVVDFYAKETKWRCINCGFVHEGPEAPKGCPACAHPQDYFELLAENW